MVRYLVAFVALGVLHGCANNSVQPATEATVPPAQTCVGSTALPPSLAASFEPVDDGALLAKAIGQAGQGLLCQGQVYQSKVDAPVVLFRAWNSTNPHSEFGNWWAFGKPDGKVADYRKDYEICYQWSPLDMLVQCTLKPGTRVVVGTGQSAQCSQYLTYPVSAAQQVFIDNPGPVMSDCTTYTGEFNWK